MAESRKSDRPAAAPEARGFLVALVTVSLVAFDMAFNLGAFGDIFFETYLKVWVAATAVILGCMVLPPGQRPMGGGGLVVMLLPTLYFPASALTTWLVSQPPQETPLGLLTQLAAALITLAVVVVYLISMPYVIYTLARILDPSLVEVPTRRMRVGLVGIGVVMAVCGATLGTLHPYWMTCDEFQTAGSDVPANCTVEWVEPGAEPSSGP